MKHYRNRLLGGVVSLALMGGAALAQTSPFATINIGSTANDGTGDSLRTAFGKVNANFAALGSAAFQPASAFAPAGSAGAVSSVAGRTGAIVLSHSDITDWGSSLAPYALTSSLGTAAAQSATAFDGAGAAAAAQSAAITAAAAAAPGLAPVQTVAGRKGAVVLTSADIGGLGSAALQPASAFDAAGAAAGVTATSIGAATTGALTTETQRATTAEGNAALKANNLSDLQNASAARVNLGLGTAATTSAAAYDAAGAATTAVGALSPTPFLVTNYGATCNGQNLTASSITSGAAVLTDSNYSFVAADVGKSVTVAGAGASGAVLNATISSVSGGAATLSKSAGTTVSGAAVTFGTDDSAAFQSAVTAAGAAVSAKNLQGAVVFAPAGICVIGTSIAWPAPPAKVSFRGQGQYATNLKWISTSDMAGKALFQGVSGNTGATPYTNLSFRDFSADGSAATSATYNVGNKGTYFQYNVNMVFDHTTFIGWPATCIGVDFLVNSQITNNYLQSCGRLGGASSSSPTPGSSGIGIATDGNWNTVESVVVSGNVSNDAYNYGIFIESQGSYDGASAASGSGRYLITGNAITDTVTPSNAGAIQSGIGDSVNTAAVIVGNVVSLPAQTTNPNSCGITVDAGTVGSTYTSTNGLIGHNTVRGGYGGLCYFGQALTANRLANYTFDGNTVIGPAKQGIIIDGATSSSYSLNNLYISNNHIISAASAGILLYSSGGTINNVHITGNDLIDNGTNTSGSTWARAGIAISVPSGSTNYDLENNVANDDQSTHTQIYGVSVNSGASISNFDMLNNTIRNATTSALSNAGTLTNAVIRDNPGLNPVGMTTATLPASGTAYVNGPYPATLYLTGGTVSAVAKGGQTVCSATPCTVPLAANDNVTVTYSSTPTALLDRN